MDARQTGSRTRALGGIAVFMLAVSAALPALAGEPAKAEAGSDWPQFMGPNRDGIAPSSPKLLDAWPKEGPKLLWKSDALPFAPNCGVGTPIVTGGCVYTYAHITLPLDGIKPFNAEFLAYWGWAADMPADLNKKIDAAVFNEARQACKTNDEVEAYCKAFLATLDAAQAAKFGETIRARMKLGRRGFNSGHLAWMGSFKDKEIKSRQDFMNLFIDALHSHIYHGGQDGPILKHADTIYKDQKWADSLICLDAATGKVLWSKEFPGVKKSWGVEFGCSGVPAVVKDRLYFAGSGGVYCLDLKKKGELVWQGKGAATHTSPVVSDGVAYFCAGELAAFDAATGKELWRQPKVKNDSGSPVLWKSNGKTYVLCSSGSGRQFWCVDAVNGAVLWQEASQGENTALAIAGDTLVSRSTGGASAHRLSLTKPELLWKTKDKEGGDHGGSPIIYQDHVYMCGQAYLTILVTVLDLKTGAVTLKQQSTGKELGGGCSTGILVDGKIIFVRDYNYKVARLFMFKASPNKYEEVGQLPDRNVVSCTSPAYAEGKVYVRMPKAIACYDLSGTK